MHEFKHGELKSGPGGKGGKTKAPLYARAKQAGIPNRSKLPEQQLENALAR